MIGSVPQGLAGVNGDLWVSVRGTVTSHRGGTLRLVSLEPPPSLDPGFAYDLNSWRVAHLLGDGLVAFEPVGAANPTLVHDLATSLPTPTEGGRTYTFTLRPGIRYSNGEVVAPADFRRAIERALRLQVFARPLFDRLVGGEACGEEPGACDLSEGIVTDDATGEITFHLVAPDPEFLYKLTLNFAYPVPPSVPSEEQVMAGVPGTGPYMLEAPMTDEGLTLVRNPNFRVWSRAAQPDGYVERIEWMFGVQPRDQVEAVAAGDADLAIDAEASGRLEELLVRFASQVYSTPMAWTEYLVLATEVPPFDDVEVRRALNSAIDRGRLVKIYGGEGAAKPTCQQLPPNFPGYEPYCPYTADRGPDSKGLWIAPRLDLEEARKIVRGSGTAGMRVVYEYSPQVFSQGGLLGHYLVEVLESLGYRASVKSVAYREFFSAGNEFQMAAGGFIADYPAASTFIMDKLNCAASLTPVSGFCDPQIDAMIERASRLQIEDPAASGALWAKIDRVLVDQAPYVWLVNPFDVDLVSERVGNYQWHIQWGGLLNQLWVR